MAASPRPRIFLPEVDLQHTHAKRASGSVSQAKPHPLHGYDRTPRYAALDLPALTSDSPEAVLILVAGTLRRSRDDAAIVLQSAAG